MPETVPTTKPSTATAWPLLLACARPRPDPEEIRLLLKNQDADAVLALAEQHGVLGLLAAAFDGLGEAVVPLDLLSSLRERRRPHLFSTMALTAELLRLRERFALAKLEIIPLKGAVLSARAYGNPGLRQYSDLDLLVRHRDMARITRLLTACGYEASVSIDAIASGKVPGEFVFLRPLPALRVEVHTEHTLRYFPRAVSIDALFARCTYIRLDGRDIAALSAEDDLLMLCVHGAKDLWARLLWVADVAALVERQPSLDWELTFERARTLGALRILHTGLRLALDLLKMRLPDPVRIAVQRDAAAAKLARQVAGWLPSAGAEEPPMVARALFRVRMRGNAPAGLAYLLRLSLSPTEDDWKAAGGNGRGVRDRSRRLLRLAGKYGRRAQE